MLLLIPASVAVRAVKYNKTAELTRYDDPIKVSSRPFPVRNFDGEDMKTQAVWWLVQRYRYPLNVLVYATHGC